MKITKIECIPVSLAPPEPIHAPSNLVVVKMHTDEGTVGVAEGGTCNQEAVIQTVSSWEPALIGADPFNVESIMGRLYRGNGGNNTAIGTIDFCLYDIIGRSLGVPVYKLLGGRSNEKIALGFVITVGPWMNPKWCAERASKAAEAGFQEITLKVGRNRPGSEDLKNVKAIRDAIGYEIKLGVDSNGGWDYYSALEALKPMEPYHLYKAEQPIPRWDVDGLVRLRQKLDIPVCAHESAMEIKGLHEVIDKNAADFLMFKLVWAPGFTVGKKWAAIAESADLQISCGCMVGSGFEAAAQAQYLCADPWMSKIAHSNIGFLLIHDVLKSADVKQDVAINPPRVENGYMYPPEGPGLGVELNEKALPELMTRGKAVKVIGK